MSSRGNETRDTEGRAVLHGTPVSPGIAVAPAFVYGDILDEIEVRRINASEVDGEVARLRDAIALVKEELFAMPGTSLRNWARVRATSSSCTR